MDRIHEQLKNENNLIEKRHESISCNTFMCSNPVTHLLVKKGLVRHSDYRISHVCNGCAKWVNGLSDFNWDYNMIVGVYKLV